MCQVILVGLLCRTECLQVVMTLVVLPQPSVLSLNLLVTEKASPSPPQQFRASIDFGAASSNGKKEEISRKNYANCRTTIPTFRLQYHRRKRDSPPNWINNFFLCISCRRKRRKRKRKMNHNNSLSPEY